MTLYDLWGHSLFYEEIAFWQCKHSKEIILKSVFKWMWYRKNSAKNMESLSKRVQYFFLWDVEELGFL